MAKLDRYLRTLNSILRILTIVVFLYALFLFVNLQPKMVAFEPLTGLEENLMKGVGLGLILILGYFLLSLFQIVSAVRDTERLSVLPLILILLGVVCVLLVFSDVALLNDINKQYKHGLNQPEWTLLFPIMGFQFLFALVLAYLHLSGYFLHNQPGQVVRDINIFLVVQYVGVVCGLMGLGLSSLGFFFPGAWSLPTHTIMGGLTLIFPYGLAVLYWGVTKLREKDRIWWDEKQYQDVGLSAMVTLVLDTVLMLCLFIFGIQDLDGVVRMLWLPFYLFGTITFFSVGNLYFCNRV